MVQIKKQLVSSRSKTYNGNNGRKYITIHETDNTKKGANAQAHANLQTNGFRSSWHWQVDDKQAIQSYPHTVQCWHGGDSRGNGNLNSIGIEICVNSDGDFNKAVKNAAKLVKKIMKDENIPLSNVVQHNKWSGKNCPSNLRSGSKGISWGGFLKLVEDKTVINKPAKNPKEQVSDVYTGNSIVSYLNSIKVDSSFANRKKLATKYGIKNYKGTAAQNLNLLSKLRNSKAPASKPKGNLKTGSIVEYLNSIKVDSSFSNRAKLAKQNGIKNYKGTASQNTQLLAKLRK